MTSGDDGFAPPVVPPRPLDVPPDDAPEVPPTGSPPAPPMPPVPPQAVPGPLQTPQPSHMPPEHVTLVGSGTSTHARALNELQL